MKSFSERFGYRAPRLELKPSDFPQPLRNNVWDALCLIYFNNLEQDANYVVSPEYSDEFLDIVKQLEFFLFRRSISDIEHSPFEQLRVYRSYFNNCNFYEAYEFIEAVISFGTSEVALKFQKFMNQILKENLAAFRIVDGRFIQVTEEEELSELEDAIAGDNAVSSVSEHIKTAASLFSGTPPDYRNSVKESISAVESAVRYVTGKKTMGVARPIRDMSDDLGLHPALRDGFDKLYAFTSDSEGVRHALMDKSQITMNDARYMLVSCAAFANYLVRMKQEAKLGNG